MKKELTIRPVVIVLVICIAVLFLIPFKIISDGYMPDDDALRHAAKAVSGKTWDEILVLRPGITLDSHIGWHQILAFIYHTTGWTVDNLVVFSIVSLAIIFFLVPIFFLKRPEAWLIVLTVISVANFLSLSRIFLGRPFILTMAVLLFLGFAWTRFNTRTVPWPWAIALTALIALATWVHCLWYMFALPAACFFIARQWRAGGVILMCTITGVATGMLMTGHPAQFFSQTLDHFSHSLGGHALPWQLVPEFRPFNGDNRVVVSVLGMLCWRALRRDWDIKAITTPIFILAVISWGLGFVVIRVWLDWGIPAVGVWMALEFERYLESAMGADSGKRIWLALAVAGVLFLSVTADYNDRWTQNVAVPYLSAENPEHKKWLPDKGGIIYNTSMPLFFRTFFANPHGDWRYILGFEPTMMPPEDLDIFRDIQLTNHSSRALERWVIKMRPADRMVLTMMSSPAVPGLDWHLALPGIWIGRLPGP